MKSLLDVIRYDGKSYSDCDEIGKQKIELLARKLQFIEAEILSHKDGFININPNGEIKVDAVGSDLRGAIVVLMNRPNQD